MRFYFDESALAGPNGDRTRAYIAQYASITFACTSCGSEATEETTEKVPSGLHHKVKCANGHVTNGMPPRNLRGTVVHREVNGTAIAFYSNGARWAFAGARHAAGYATVDDAMIEAELQLTGQYTGPLNPEGTHVPRKTHAASVARLKELTGRGW